MRVNKAWYALASPFLYEHIILGRSKVLQPLLEGMNRSAKTAHGELSRPIGWWTQRLDVNMRDKPNRNPQIEMNALAGILTHLPNLRILTFSITGHRYRETLPSNVLHSLICRDTLRIVHWYTPHFPSIESLSALLEDHLHLESVNANEIMNTSIPQIQLNSLNTVHVRWPGFITMETPAFISYVWALDLPAVRYATYNLEFSVNNDLLVRGFFAAIGPRLQIIQLVQRGNADYTKVRLHLDATYVKILQNCHSLQQINLLFDSWEILWLCLPQLPTGVHTLVFCTLREEVTGDEILSLLRHLLELKSRNPGLKTIQLYSEINIRALQKYSFTFRSGLLKLNSNGLSVLDNEGTLMSLEYPWT